MKFKIKQFSFVIVFITGFYGIFLVNVYLVCYGLKENKSGEYEKTGCDGKNRFASFRDSLLRGRK